MYSVLQNPEVHERLLADESERAWAVKRKHLRWERWSKQPRVTLQDVVMPGVEIPARQMVRLFLPVANRDPCVFPTPIGGTSTGAQRTTSHSGAVVTYSRGVACPRRDDRRARSAAAPVA